jgi:hypothetical protein
MEYLFALYTNSAGAVEDTSTFNNDGWYGGGPAKPTNVAPTGGLTRAVSMDAGDYITSTVSQDKVSMIAWMKTNAAAPWKYYAVCNGTQYVDAVAASFAQRWTLNGNQIRWGTNAAGNLNGSFGPCAVYSEDKKTSLYTMRWQQYTNRGATPWDAANTNGLYLQQALACSMNYSGIAADQSTNGNHGTLGSGITWAATGQNGGNGYLVMNGATTAYVTVSDSASLDFGTNLWTVSCWVKDNSRSTDHGLFSKRLADGTAGIEFYLYRTNAVGLSTNYIILRGAANNLNGYFKMTNFADSLWHNIVIQRTGPQTLAAYVDAKAQGIAYVTQNTVDINTTAPLYIGRMRNNTGPYSGNVDEFRWARGVLTPAQVTSLWQSATNYIK